MSSDGELQLIYQDRAVLAVDKPPWWVVHRTRGARGAPVLVDTLRRQTGGPIYTVHRLDRQTSGVMLFARDADVAAALGAQIRDNLWHKTYCGLCRGIIADELRVDRGVKEGQTRRPALTEILPLEHLCERYTLLRAVPRSGRRHQIRYHLRHISHPLAGDTRHGRGDLNRFFRQTFGLQRMFLHAASLRLPHPLHNRYLELEVPLAPDLERVLERMRAYTGPVV
jgi:tRNA pseudouridine65 synthase